MPSKLGLRSIWVGAVFVLASGTSYAQAPTQGMLRGFVRDSSGYPVKEAQVSIAALGRTTRTDADGRFVLDAMPRGPVELSIRHLGFGHQTVSAVLTTASVDSILITLAENVVELDAIDVKARRHPFMIEFDQRKARGVGTFVTRAQIDARNTSSPSDLFRSMPQVRLIRINSGFGVRFPSSGQMRGRGQGVCVPMIWIDGQKAPGMEIDDLRSGDIEAIELYRGASTTPAQFATAGATQCGAVVVWTRRRM